MFPMIQTTFGDTMYTRTMPDTSRVFDFNDFQRAVASIDAEQIDGNPGPETSCGVPYTTISSGTICRKGDEHVITKYVCESALNNIIGLIDQVQRNRHPNGGIIRLEWRIRPEFEICDTSVVLRYDENGPDMDHATDRKCVKDYDWRLVRVYARVAVIPVS